MPYDALKKKKKKRKKMQILQIKTQISQSFSKSKSPINYPRRQSKLIQRPNPIQWNFPVKSDLAYRLSENSFVSITSYEYCQSSGDILAVC